MLQVRAIHVLAYPVAALPHLKRGNRKNRLFTDVIIRGGDEMAFWTTAEMYTVENAMFLVWPEENM